MNYSKIDRNKSYVISINYENHFGWVHKLVQFNSCVTSRVDLKQNFALWSEKCNIKYRTGLRKHENVRKRFHVIIISPSAIFNKVRSKFLMNFLVLGMNFSDSNKNVSYNLLFSLTLRI